MNRRRSLLAVALVGVAVPVRAAPVDDFFRAIRRDDARAVIVMLLRGFDANTPDSAGRTGLQLALQLECFAAADALLAAPGLDVDRPNERNETPLMLAAIKGQLALCKKLVQRGAQIVRPGWSPLHYAATAPDAAVLDWLLSQGADVDAEAPNGNTPLMMAAAYGSFASVERLLAAGAATHVTNEAGLRAADFAARAGRDVLARRLADLARR